jgi:hypothetical protein
MSFDVTDPAYGAVFDGVTDDTSAIQDALDACNSAGGGAVDMPNGTAIISEPLIVYSNVTLRGQGMNVTILKTSANASTAVTGGAIIKELEENNGSDNLVLEGFTITGNGDTAPSGSGIILDAGVHQFFEINNVKVQNFPDDNMYISQPITSIFRKSHFKQSGGKGLFVELGTSCTFESLYTTGNNEVGLYLKDHTYSNILNTASEYSTFCYYLNNCSNITMNSVGSEVCMHSDESEYVAHIKIRNSQNIILNAQYASKFAYLDDVSAYHLYVENSDITVNSPRFRTVLGGADPGEVPTANIYIDNTSDVIVNSPVFEGDRQYDYIGNPIENILSIASH